MNALSVLKNITGKTGMFMTKHSSEICTGVAIVSSIAATGFAIKATIDIQDDIDHHKRNISHIKDSYNAENETFLHDEPVKDGNEVVDMNTVEVKGTEAIKQYKRDLTTEYAKTGLTVAKYYAIPVVLELLAVATTFESNKISRRRNAELAAGLTAVQTMYDKYRQNVIDKYGEEEDRAMRLGLHKEKINAEVEDTDGKKKKTKVENEQQDPDIVADIWCRCFDEGSVNWKKDYMLNRNFLLSQQAAMNNMLVAKRYLTVNEVYDALDLPQCELGQTWGWIYDPDICTQINFGLKDIDNPAKRAFINGDERNVFIDFTIAPYYIGDRVWKTSKLFKSKYNYI